MQTISLMTENMAAAVSAAVLNFCEITKSGVAATAPNSMTARLSTLRSSESASSTSHVQKQTSLKRLRR